MKADTLNTIITNDMIGFPEKFGAEFYFMHRVDLHTELRRLAEEPDSETSPVKITLSSEVIDVDIDTAELTLHDGSKHRKDLIVAADGVHVRSSRSSIQQILTQLKSFLTAKIIGSENPAHSTGQSAFRFLIPTEKLLQDPEARKVIEGRPDGIYLGSAPDRRLVWYPCRA